MSKYTILSVAVAAAALPGAFTAPTNASLVFPGGSVPPDAYAVTASSITLNTMSISGISTGGIHNFSFTLQDVVVEVAPGFPLDFLVQIENTTPGAPNTAPIDRVAETGFAGYRTDAGYILPGQPPFGGLMGIAGQAAPTLVSRSSSPGATVSFDIDIPNAVPVGNTSLPLPIDTNAFAYMIGSLTLTGSLVNGGIVTVPAFVPVPIAEPGSLSLLAIGLAALLTDRIAARLPRSARRRTA